jgi:putative flippase GtrA
MNKRSEFLKLVKYALVGVINTALTFLTFVLLRFWEVDIDLSNFFSYVVGVLNSFLWNKLWVFRSVSEKSFLEFVSFLLGAGFCWGLQWISFRLLLEWGLVENFAQLFGMVVYTVLGFIYNRWVTFRSMKKNKN